MYINEFQKSQFVNICEFGQVAKLTLCIFSACSVIPYKVKTYTRIQLAQNCQTHGFKY